METEKSKNNLYTAQKSKWIAYLLNGFLWPFGFFYLKDQKRFLFFSFLFYFLRAIYWFIWWLFIKIANGPTHFLLLMTVPLVFLITILYQTHQSLQNQTKSTWFIFKKQHALWFIPLYLILATPLENLLKQYKPLSANHISGRAMEPNMQVGDFVITDNLFDKTQLKRGDIITHYLPKDPNFRDRKLIKRIIGLPGDHITLKTKKISHHHTPYNIIIITINDQPVKYSLTDFKEENLQAGYKGQTFNFLTVREYLGKKSYPVVYLPVDEYSISILYDDLDIILKNNQYFVMGDNRNDSYDSRIHGPIEKDDIAGIYKYTYFSVYMDYTNCKNKIDGLEFSPKNILLGFISGCPTPQWREKNILKVAP